jgi:hypothetical protein
MRHRGNVEDRLAAARQLGKCRPGIPKQSLQMDEIAGVEESMDDAIQFKFISAPLTAQQVAELIQIPRP